VDKVQEKKTIYIYIKYSHLNVLSPSAFDTDSKGTKT